MVTRRIWPALLAIAMLVPAAPAQAKPKLALRVGALSRAPSSVRRGGTFTVAYKVTRAGSGLKRATLRFYLSRAAKKKAALGLGGPVNYISPEEGALRDKNPGEEGRAWDGWKEKAK
jgi:hypothetical protein